ncbi:hypothetical protein RJ55_08541 [Drechmeria coniospora]|nr:hypothetical protein RJ55_08541 [Drechmeria coniospora]
MATDEAHGNLPPSQPPTLTRAVAMDLPRDPDVSLTVHDDADDDASSNLLPRGEPEPLPRRDAGGAESSFVDATVADQTRGPDETMTEEDVHRHFNDVESSFLPRLSPIPTGSTNGVGGLDDTYLFDSPSKAKRQGDEPDNSTVSRITETLETLDSSPTAAAAARTISRVVGLSKSAPPKDDAADFYADGDQDEPASPRFSVADDPSSSQAPETMDAADTSGHSLRAGKRSKYLRTSRFGSQRSSTSSFATNPESIDGSDATVGLGLDYALRSGALGLPRVPSALHPRSISFGSIVSGIHLDEPDTPSTPHLEPLAEIDSPPQSRPGQLSTPKASKENLNAPTDTVIAQHVRDVHVPESLAKEYKAKNGLHTPRRQASTTAGTATTNRTSRNLTLKEQSSNIERLSKENFDLKLKVMFLSDRLDKLSEEGVKEMISENVNLKTSLAVLQRDNKILRKRVKELERQAREEEDRPSTARSAVSSFDQAAKVADGEAEEREVELVYLRERVEEYAAEIERLQSEGAHQEGEKRKLAELVRTLGERNGENVSHQEEADVWKDLLEQETARREQADEDNRNLRDELFQLKRESTGAMHHTTNIYNITKKDRARARALTASSGRPTDGHASDAEASSANLSGGTTLVDELRRESELLRHENAELRREVGAQTSMLTSRNREKDRLYLEIEELKMAQRRGGLLASNLDSILERSVSRAGRERSHSRGSGRTMLTAEEDAERDELENRLAEVRDKLNEARLQNQELQQELEACMEDFESAVEAKRTAEEAATTVQQDFDTAMNDLVALQAERDEALREQAEMENEFEALRREAQGEIESLEAEADLRNEAVQRLQADLRDRSENFDGLQQEMRKMSEALVRLEDEQDDKMRRIQQLEEELESSNGELEALERKLMEASDKNQRLTVQQESSQGEIAFLREEQEVDKVRIGDLEAALANTEQSVREEKDRARELDDRLRRERVQRELVADKEKEEVQQFLNELNREASMAKDEVRRLRKSLSSREVEATEWKERLIELENNLREALGDLSGTRSSLLKSIAKMQRELENTVRELDTTRASLTEKDHIIKQRDALLESHALESRRVAELLDKERVAHRNTKSQFDTFQNNHHHLSQTASTQDVRISELESTRSQDRRKLAALEQSTREQLTERNELLLRLWHRLGALCGREWLNGHTLVDRQAVPSMEVVATRLPGFSKNLLGAVKTIEGLFVSFQTKIKAVERDLQREYQSLESNLEVRTKKLDRLELMVRNSIASRRTGTQDGKDRVQQLEDAYRQLKQENASLRSAKEARSKGSRSSTDGTLTYAAGGSPSPSVPRGPGDRDRSRGSRQDRSSRTAGSASSATATAIPRPATSNGSIGSGGMDVALAGDAGASNNNSSDNRWLFRLRDMEYKLKMEREGRNQDRQAARQRLGGLELENRDLRDRMRRTNSQAD